jgi:hypothetical protein
MAILFLTFDKVEVTLTDRHSVGVVWRASYDATGLAPDLYPGVELTPTEARHLARRLRAFAAAAEAGLPRA